MNRDSSPNEARVQIAQRVVERKRRELGPLALAGAAYGSVAHQASLLHSDVEIVVIVEGEAQAGEETYFEDGIMVACDMVPSARMLSAAQRVTNYWGIQADQYRHHLVIWDPTGFFPRLWDAANSLPDEAFARAQEKAWWWAYEVRGKFLNALLTQDRARTV